MLLTRRILQQVSAFDDKVARGKRALSAITLTVVSSMHKQLVTLYVGA